MNNGFKYFPKDLYSKPVKMIAALSSAVKAFGMSRPSEIFFTIKDGLFNDLSIWQTVSGRVGRLPTANDDVYIKHTVLQPINTPFSCFNMFISGTGVWSRNSSTGNNAVNVFGNLKCSGVLSGQPVFNLYGTDNFIDMTRGQDLGTINYSGAISQPIMPIAYNVLGINGTGGAKYLIANTTCQSFGGTGLNNFLNIGPWDFTCNGAFTNFAPTFCDGNGYILFRGAANFSGRFGAIGAPTIEFQNGVTNWLKVGFSSSASGFGQVLFTTNNQSFDNNNTEIVAIDAPIIINSGITLTVTNVTNLQVNASLNGVDGTSSVINRATILFNNASNFTMATGVLNITSFANTVGYIFNGSGTLPYATYSSLFISGTGIKTTSVNTTVNNVLTIGTNGNLTLGGDLTVGSISMTNAAVATLQCSSYNLVVNGTTAIRTNIISKNSNIGTITFNGAVSMANGEGFNFSGNPNVEFKAGLDCTNIGGANTNTGTGQWKFSTSNQLFTMAGSSFPTMNASILISGAITLTMRQTFAVSTMNINNTIDGDNAGSALILTNGLLTFIFNNVLYALPMSTFGTFSPTGGILQYSFNGNFTLPYTAYGGLNIGGTGTKTLLGDTTVGGNLSLVNNQFGTLECSTFNLTVTGQTSVQQSTSLKKSGAGNLVFIGSLRASTSLVHPTSVEFSGNPNVELRAGMYFVNITGAAFISGTGTYTFSTNNQNIDTNGALTFNGNVVIGNNITLSYNAPEGAFSSLIFIGTMNGSNAASTFRMGTGTGIATVSYRSVTQPMATGVLDTSTNLNTWIYGLNNQDIKGSPTISPKQVYRNLTLNGTGVKTLQGYVSVLNTYTLTAPATLALNGFTLTNP
jgi:hypothetical protein